MISGGSRISTIRGGANLLFGKNLTENCMKIKEIGPGGASPASSLDSPIIITLLKDGKLWFQGHTLRKAFTTVE